VALADWKKRNLSFIRTCLETLLSEILKKSAFSGITLLNMYLLSWKKMLPLNLLAKFV